jgi:hypothetical protein
MIAVTVVSNESAAEVVCGLLRTNGIACGYGQTDFGAGAADGFPGGGPVEIFVAEEDAEEARKLLDSVKGGH